MAKGKERPGCLFYFEWIPVLEKLSDEERGQLLFAALKYAKTEELPAFESGSKPDLLWPLLENKMFLDGVRYELTVEEKKWAGKYARYKDEQEKMGKEPMSFDEYKEMYRKVESYK